jgi:hypothetical protein
MKRPDIGPEQAFTQSLFVVRPNARRDHLSREVVMEDGGPLSGRRGSGWKVALAVSPG